MKNLFIAFLIALMFVACNKSESPTPEEADHLAWCDSIYHQNVGCPKHGQVEIPPEVLAKQEADHLAWCDSIGHRNVGCPGYGD